MLLRAALIAAVIATVPVGWAAMSYAQAPIAAATTAPTFPVISADDQCGDGWEWSKTVGRCIPVPTAAPAAPAGGDLSVCRWGLFLQQDLPGCVLPTRRY
jgi:hypothetical protein